jgi:hypothetical protein
MKPLVAFPYYSYHIPPDAYNKQELIDSMLHNYQLEPSRNEWNPACDMHHEYNDVNNTEFIKPNYDQLIPVYTNVIQTFMNDLNFQRPMQWRFSIENYTVTTQTQHMITHNHLPSQYAAVHYLSFSSEEHTSTVFQNPSLYSSVLSLYYDNLRDALPPNSPHALPFYSDYDLPVSEDELIIFPSMLDHYVKPSRSSKPRITIAFNIYIENDTSV